MAILVFDFGGTTVKYSVWVGDKLDMPVSSFPTPKTWEETKTAVREIKDKLGQSYPFKGVAFSFPGCIEQKSGQILGYSAIPFIHHFPIKAELEALLELPISLENDANCAALAEVWTGVGKGLQDILFVVVGTGIGGAIVMDGKVRSGAHLYGGEWGFMFVNGGEDGRKGQILSGLGTAVAMANRYCEAIGVPVGTHGGAEVFKLAKEGDEKAQVEVETFYRYLSMGLFNLQMSFDPEAIILGGGISASEEILEELEKRVNDLLIYSHVKDFKVDLKACQYGNDANLIGAVKNFMDRVEV